MSGSSTSKRLAGDLAAPFLARERELRWGDRRPPGRPPGAGTAGTARRPASVDLAGANATVTVPEAAGAAAVRAEGFDGGQLVEPRTVAR